MLENIDIRSENGKIKVFWEWAGEGITGVVICYRRSEMISGDGTEFTKGKVIRYPGVRTGNAERKLVDECGLYTFTFAVQLENGAQGEKIVIDHIALGNPVKIYWKIQNTKEGMLLSFLQNQVTLKAGIVSVIYGRYRYIFRQEISDAVKLLFPKDIHSENVILQAVNPYDKIYHFIRQ